MPSPSAFLSSTPLPSSISNVNFNTCNRRRRRVVWYMQADTNPFDDTFFLSSEDIARVTPINQTKPQELTIAQRRAQRKQIELDNTDGEDEVEKERRNMVDEDISAADLFGSIENTNDTQHQVSSKATVVSTIPKNRIQTSATKKKPRQQQAIKEKEHIEKSKLEPNNVDDNTLRPNDLVMHSRHGIGKFRGLERTRASVSAPDPKDTPLQEFAVIEYRDGDVYVPLSHMEMMRPLNNIEAKSVSRLDTISGAYAYPSGIPIRSKRTSYHAKKKTRSKIRKQLVNLHGLYAQRISMERDPFSIDEQAEKKFFKNCPFKLTDDQKTATARVLSDMSERRQPMDRLLCGDVGFGKTEVAIRAAFRALSAGKQIAVLAPTTILAQQHYETFHERFEKDYPQYKIACLTRFVPRKQITAAKSGIQTGEYQIAIGTHMLLNDSFKFQDLGLLIVDEEHRFGVNQKEKMRARYRAVDTLFLSATPIPRTLHLTLSGLRDASILRTPPSGRKPIITRVSPSGSGIIRRAIQKEVDRGGQVFFVVPRIEGIDACTKWIQDLFPNLRVQVAHGSIGNLEKRIWSFAHKEYDILVCTTIIENGINMPDVNTVIIQDACKFGLAQLHQLRGRVGRSDVQAYAYFLYSSTSAATNQKVPAIDRLKALEKYSNLGSGFAIAQRDMEMRGVGTILGVEQHGNNSVGAEEYATILAEELEFARTGRPTPPKLPSVKSTEIFLPVASLIPPEYIADFDDKMNAYGYLSKANSIKSLNNVVKDLELRYGPLPPPTRRHVCVLELKLFGKQLGITRIMAERQHVVLNWVVEENTLKCLVAFLPDETTRMKCEHLAAEEKVVIRGLGVCSGDVQLAKLRIFLRCFSKAAAGFENSNRDITDANGLLETLYDISIGGQ